MFDRLSMLIWGFLIAISFFAASFVLPGKILNGPFPKQNTEVLKYLENPEKAILYSLDPSVRLDSPKYFHGFKILGSLELESDFKDVVAINFSESAKAFEGKAHSPRCFNPRAGLQVIKDGKTVDFVLCFECQAMQVYSDGKLIGELNVHGSDTILNTIFQYSHIPISKVDK